MLQHRSYQQLRKQSSLACTPCTRSCRSPYAFRTTTAASKQHNSATDCRNQCECPAQQQQQQHQQQQRWTAVQSCVAAGLLALAATATPLVIPEPTFAADTVKVGTCLLQKCQRQLAQCLGDPMCLQNIVCLNLCNSAEDEAGCQIRCGDLYGDKAIDTFNACAVSDQKCVPQRQDEGLYPIPPDCALDEAFDLNMFQGRWYITAGQNPLFDIFDCQEHFFAVAEPGKLAAKINWRINKPNGDFIERSTIQTFVQDKEKPSILYNHGNEYLHYQDDWYILASKPDSYVVIYYKGTNDAWDGYGGATIYTRARQLPEELIPELSAAVEKVGFTWKDFTVTDNSCKPHPPAKSLVQEIEEDAGKLEKGLEKEAAVLEQDLEQGLRSFGRGFTVLEQRLEKELTADELALQREIQAELKAAEKLLAKVEREVEAEERSLVDSFSSALQQLTRVFKQ